MKKIALRVKKTIPTVEIPKDLETPWSYELKTPIKIRIAGNTVKAVRLGLSIKIPDKYICIITNADTKGLLTTIFVKQAVIAGKVDEINVYISNFGMAPVTLPTKAVIAQIICLPKCVLRLNEVDLLDEIEAPDKVKPANKATKSITEKKEQVLTSKNAEPTPEDTTIKPEIENE